MKKIYTLENADQYIEKNKNTVNEKYKNKFHFTPQIGWINDPNGFSFFNGEYHLFYQFHPYDSVWGPMHWGHAKSTNLIHWTHLKTALSPCDSIDDLGCFSGSAIEENGKHILFYTGVIMEDMKQFQRQCIAIGDGIKYKKQLEKHIITESDLPEELVKEDFRDPKVFKYKDMFHCIIGSKSKDQKGVVVLFLSKNMYDWEYRSVFNKSTEVNGGVYECPDYFQLQDRDVLIVSPMNKAPEVYNYYNNSSSIYKIGKYIFEIGEFESQIESEIDCGFDFYAPQTLIDDRGRRIMIAWMQMWGRNYPTNDENHNWCGSMTLPRVLTIIGDKLYQYPVEEINNYRKSEFNLELDFCGEFTHKELNGKYVDLQIEFEFREHSIFGVKLYHGREEGTIFTFDTKNETVTFDRSKSGIKLQSNRNEMSNLNIRTSKITFDSKIIARFILDNTSVEAFFNQGEKAMTGNIYSSYDSRKIVVFSNTMISSKIIKHDLVYKLGVV
jgi:beta-fructofuranosidase